MTERDAIQGEWDIGERDREMEWWDHFQARRDIVHSGGNCSETKSLNNDLWMTPKRAVICVEASDRKDRGKHRHWVGAIGSTENEILKNGGISLIIFSPRRGAWP